MTTALRSNPLAAHVGPLLVFMLLGSVPGWFRVENSALPWYVQQPEHWWYPVQTLVCAALLLWWRPHYHIAACKPSHLALAALGALIGITLWILPGWLHAQWTTPALDNPGWWKWLGLADRSEGFDPTLLQDHPVGQKLSLILRFARSTLVVPFVEELCWRGWLMRHVIAGDKSFTRIPFGTHSWKAYWITTLAVTLIHNPEDWLAAFLWGSLVYALAIHTKSLRACIVMHALGNLILGIYILKTGQYGYW
jgi:CAAX prenyl protease-like protein